MKTRFKFAALFTGLCFLLCLQASCQAPVAASKSATDQVFDGINYKYKTQHVTLADGTTIAYTDLGKGPETIIFIHGLGSYLPAWNKNLETFSQHYRTIALDLPGYGKSSKENVQVGMAHYADAVLELMDKLKLKQAILAGHSMGGQIAITAALKAPERVKKLILAAPAGLETFTDQQKQLFKVTVTPESVQKTTPEQVAANFKVNFYQMPADAQFMIDDRLQMAASEQFGAYSTAVAQSVAAMVDEPVADRLGEIEVPTLIIFGANDALIPNKYFNPLLTPEAVARAGAEKIKNSQVVLLPETGHFLQFEKPEQFNKAVSDFLKK